jgi:predicted ArsR family transcriptional regulator
VTRATKAIRQVVELVRAHGQMTLAEIANSLGLSTTTANSRCRKGIEAGWLKRERYGVYSLSDAACGRTVQTLQLGAEECALAAEALLERGAELRRHGQRYGDDLRVRGEAMQQLAARFEPQGARRTA